MSLQRSNVLICKPHEAACGVCGWRGRLHSYDLSLGKHLCAHCLPATLAAEALLRAAGFEHPCTGLIWMNP